MALVAGAASPSESMGGPPDMGVYDFNVRTLGRKKQLDAFGPPAIYGCTARVLQPTGQPWFRAYLNVAV